MKYRLKSDPTIVVTALSLDMLLQIARATEGTSIHKGVPWSFMYAGVPFTHDTDDQYILAGTRRFRHGQVFIPEYPLDQAVVNAPEFFDLYEPADPADAVKTNLVRLAKEYRQTLDKPLQLMKALRDELATPGTPLSATFADPKEVVPNLQLSIRHVEDGIMRLGMMLKAIGNPNPYPQSYNPDSPVVEKTADDLVL